MASVASLAGALALFACVGDTPVTPVPDAGVADTGGGDVNVKPDATGDAAPPLLTCQGSETLETFEDPMNRAANVDLCVSNTTVLACDQGVTNGVAYGAGTLTAATKQTAAAPNFSFAARSFEALGSARAVEAIVTYELTVDSLDNADAGWSSVGCYLDLADYNDAGTATALSRVEIAASGGGGSAWTWTTGNRAGGTSSNLSGFSTSASNPMTVSIKIDKRAAPKAVVSVSSTNGSGSANLNPVGASALQLSCGAGREGPGVNKVSIRKIRYARCLKP